MSSIHERARELMDAGGLNPVTGGPMDPAAQAPSLRLRQAYERLNGALVRADKFLHTHIANVVGEVELTPGLALTFSPGAGLRTRMERDNTSTTKALASTSLSVRQLAARAIPELFEYLTHASEERTAELFEAADQLEDWLDEFEK